LLSTRGLYSCKGECCDEETVPKERHGAEKSALAHIISEQLCAIVEPLPIIPARVPDSGTTCYE